MDAEHNNAIEPRAQRVLELFALFLRLGVVGFGGPAAHIALMEDEVVQRRRWLTRQEFLDLLGATNLIPGPNSTEMAIHIGYRRAGAAGLIVAGVSFILPAVLIVSAMAWAYSRYGSLPQMKGLLDGVKPVVLAVIAHALVRLAKVALSRMSLMVAAVVGAIANALGAHELLVLFAGAAAVAVYENLRTRRGSTAMVAGGILGAHAITSAAPIAAATTSAATFALPALFLTFLKIGCVLFGSGYVLIAFLRADFVERLGWLTEAQLVDAVAVGQITPGPLFTTATFVGYLMAGGTGAAVATIGIFLPAFLFVAATAPFLPRLRQSRSASLLLDGLNALTFALMAVVSAQLGVAVLRTPFAIVLFIAAFLLLLRTRLNSTWLILAGASSGIIKVMAT